MVPTLTPASLEYALSKTKEFWLVHRNSDTEQRAEAMTVLLGHLSFDDENKLLFCKILRRLGLAPSGEGSALLGALLILHAFDYFNDISA